MPRTRSKKSRTVRENGAIGATPTPDIDAKDYLPPLDPELKLPEAEGEPPKRHYSKRKSKSPGGSLGQFMQGLGSMIANGTTIITGQEAPLTKAEGEMLSFVGDRVQEFGDTSAFDEDVGKYGMYLLVGSFAFIALGRVVPYFLQKRRRQIPEVIPEVQ